MKINLRIIAVMLALSMLVISSCKDDNEPEPLSTVEAEAVLDNMGGEMEIAMQEMMATPAAGAMFNFMFLTDSYSDVKGQAIPLFSKFNEVNATDASLSAKAMGLITKMVSAGEYVNPFGEESGTYTWDFGSNSWTYSAQPADKLLYLFPSDSEQTSNNATLTLSDYVGVEQGVDFFATSLKVALHIDNDLVLNVDYEADLSASSLNSVSISVNMIPFEMGANLTLTSGQGFTTITAEFELKKLNVIITSANVELRVDGMDSINPFEVDDSLELIPTTAKGYLQMGEVKAQLDLAPADFVAVYDNTTSHLAIIDAANEHLNISFFTFPEGAKLGVVVWKWDDTIGDMVPFFQFNDGTEKPLEDVLGIDLDLYSDFDF